MYAIRSYYESDGYFDLTLSRKDIAEFAGISQEQVIRQISELKKEGLIITSGKIV